MEFLSELPEFYSDLTNNCQITFILKSLYTYQENNINSLENSNNLNSIENLNNSETIIINLHNHIFNGDKIIVRLTKAPILYYLQGYNLRLYSSYCLKDIYQYYFNIIKNIANEEIFIYACEGSVIKLVDVLDDGKKKLDQCINRLIKKYNY